MKKVLFVLSLLFVTQAFAAARWPTSVKFTQGQIVRTLPVPSAAAWGKGPLLYTETLTATGLCQFKLGGQMVQFAAPCDTVTRDWVYPTCPPVPPAVSRTQDCAVTNPGTTGTWTQTHGWTQSLPPGCVNTPTPWLPTAAPAGACTPVAVGQPPHGNFHFVVTGNRVDFAGSTNSADPDGWLVGWSWNFGDGGTSTQQNPTHVYAAAGTYTATETITDNDGLTSTTSQPITIGSVTPPGCPPIPANAETDTPCPNGNGTFHQTHGWSQGAPPVCALTTLPWLPAAPLPTDCTQVQPPPLTLFNIDLSYVDQTGPAFLRFKFYVDTALSSGGTTFALRPIDQTYMFKITGSIMYAQAAIAEVDAIVTAAAAAGAHPDVASDSYLGAGENIGAVAITYAWANSMLSPTQKTRWKAYVDQCLFNIWNAAIAQWNGLPAPWSNWSTDNPYNNYYYSFIQATMWGALAFDSQAIVHDGKTALEYLRTDRLPRLTNAYALIPHGGSYEGTGYGASHLRLFELYQVWHDSNQGDITNPHMTNSGEFWVYGTMPTMDRFVPIGDQSRISEPWWYDYHRTLVMEVFHQTTSAQVRNDIGFLLANLKNGDGTPYDEQQNTYNFRYDMLPHPAGNAPFDLAFFAPEIGFFSTRTDWGRDACALFGLFGRYSESHAHHEQAGFTFFCKGLWLSVPANVWSHSGVHQDEAGKSIVRFFRGTTEIMQKFDETKRVNVTTWAPQANGNLRVVGDVSPIYADAGVSWVRIFDDITGSVTISDSMTLGTGVTSVWQLQVPVLPVIAGNVVTAGRLRMTVLAPLTPQITTVNMHNLDADYPDTGVYCIQVRGPVGTTSYQVKLDAI